MTEKEELAWKVVQDKAGEVERATRRMDRCARELQDAIKLFGRIAKEAEKK